MTKPGLRSLIRRLLAAQAGSAPDRALLERFLTARDEAAFAALVERHGAMVLGVARNVLHNHQDAEDVFQATFLVLARKAGSVRKQGSLGSWLHGVAYRLALNARTAAAVRRRHESGSPGRAPATSADDLTWRELSAVLHEELERLPDRYRAPLVLCYLEGMTQDEAAEHLGLAKGTLKGRLERARLLLRGRLGRRGLAPAVVLLADACWPAGAAPAAPRLSTTTRAAVAVAAGGPSGASASVARLTEGALRAMFVRKLRFTLALLLAVGLVAAGAHLLTSHEAPGGPPATAAPAPEKQVGERVKEMPWGKPVGGWRMRLTPSATEYRRNTPLILMLEFQNVSAGPLALKSLGWWCPDPEVTEGGKRLVARPVIDVTPWEGARGELPAGASIKWAVDFNRLRFARQPLKAGAVLRVRFRLALPGEGALPPRLFSNEVSLRLRDDHPSVMSGSPDLPAKWSGSTELVYREHVPFVGYSALRIDGTGRVWLVSIGRAKRGKARAELVRTEAMLSRDRLDRLARFLREQKVWEVATLAPDSIPVPDEGDARLSLGAGRGTLVRNFPDSVVRGHPKLLRLRQEMEDVKADALRAADAKKARP
jgi:RNA polymerase sigma factor (sigma-70 family)